MSEKWIYIQQVNPYRFPVHTEQEKRERAERAAAYRAPDWNTPDLWDRLLLSEAAVVSIATLWFSGWLGAIWRMCLGQADGWPSLWPLLVIPIAFAVAVGLSEKEPPSLAEHA